MAALGAMMVGGNPAGKRQDRDFYPTPVDVVWSLLSVEKFEGSIWEPACGNGQLALELEKGTGCSVFGTDIVPQGYGKKANFLELRPRPLNANIVTNPPFNLAKQFFEQGMAFRPHKMALLLKSTYFHASTRLPLFEKYRPAMVYPLTWRPDFLGLGRPTLEVAWYVWYRGHNAYPEYRPLPRYNSLEAALRAL